MTRKNSRKKCVKYLWRLCHETWSNLDSLSNVSLSCILDLSKCLFRLTIVNTVSQTLNINVLAKLLWLSDSSFRSSDTYLTLKKKVFLRLLNPIIFSERPHCIQIIRPGYKLTSNTAFKTLQTE